jgi:glycosyltransferase involved in cell wall biosynthesis
LSEWKKVSVIIPVKNEEKKIARCLEAVFNQTRKPFEVIIVDGNSTDKTVEVASKFPVRILYDNHASIGGARQIGVEEAHGDYIAFIDSDCIPEKDWLENLIKEFDDGIVGIGGGIINIGEGVWRKSINLALDTFLGSANSVQGRLFKNKRYVKSISGCNSLYRKRDLIAIGGFNTKLSLNEETELNRRLLKRGRLLYIPNAVVYHDNGRGLRDFAKRMYQYGYGRGENRLWDIQIIPPIIAMIVPFLLLISTVAFFSMIFLYILILFSYSIGIWLRIKDFKLVLTIPLIFAIEHLMYTIGFWIGIMKNIKPFGYCVRLLRHGS